jgi:DNA-directed RNA polymerase subunit beta'
LEIKEFNAIRISLASPEEIKAWSHGEVTKPETINYRRLRPEKDGLFCEAIFGPTKDWQCYCGKYKKIRYRGIVCDKCGVEVTRSRVRRERMGHIDLASPVAHIWYTRRVPSYLGILLDISRRNLDRVLYFAQYIITSIDEEERKRVLKRLEEEHQETVRSIRKDVDERSGVLRGQVDEALSGLKAEVDEKKASANAALEVATSELMAAAAALQKKMKAQKAKPATADMIFEPMEAVIVTSGAVVDSTNFDALNEMLQARLSDLEAEAEDAVRVVEDRFAGERDRLSREVEGQIGGDELTLDSQLAGAESAYREQRDAINALAVRQMQTESEYWELKERYGAVFQAGMGAEALYDIVSKMDLDALAREMRDEIMHGRSKQRRKKATKRLKVVEALRRSHNRPEWMILKVLPVIPPDLRPMVQLDGGRFATSDLNDLYRRVINRNNRLLRLLELGAPDVIIRNEKRMLQEAVDSLIDNSRRGKAVSARGRRKLKSLSDMLKGKQGRFRRNLLGKRVDYSGRSVIVIGPQLKLHQCGLPKGMALELFRPFVMRKLVEYNYAHNVKGAKRLIEKTDPVVWEVLEEIIQDYPVLLNRAPTLHRLGIQAFQPVLVEGNAIQIHPLVCAAFNADFDGDMMAVHVPLSEKAKREARELMLSSHNLLKPASGEPIVEPVKDMVLGTYYLTMERAGARGEGKAFTGTDEVKVAYDLDLVDLHAKIKLLVRTWYDENQERFADGDSEERVIDTTVGRALFNMALPDQLRFYDPGIPLGKGEIKTLVAEAFRVIGPLRTADLVDDIKDVGFEFATRSGLSIAVDDIHIPVAKTEIIAEADEVVNELNQQYRRGLITDEERYVRTIEIWTHATEELTDAVKADMPQFGSIRTMASSGATKGGFTPIRQLAGMRGLMGDPSGRIIDLPIRSNFREGLTTLEYFISTHGARKGLADTALRTADAGYLTRRLVDVAQDAIINDVDCGTTEGIVLLRRTDKIFNERLSDRLFGRTILDPLADPTTGEIVVPSGALVDDDNLALVEALDLEEARVRSPLTCELRHGICRMCYGADLARGGWVNVGEAVGIIAAQSIGEPGTQLTLRTFHTGGVATGGGGDITQGLPRLQELFEARTPKGEAIIADIGGRVTMQRENEVLTLSITSSRMVSDEVARADGDVVKVADGQAAAVGDVIIERGSDVIKAEHAGVVEVTTDSVYVRYEERVQEDYVVPAGARLRVKDGDIVEPGQQMTEGSKSPHRILAILGTLTTQEYLLNEIQKVYRSQGVSISDKHLEIIIRQMLSKVRVLRPGDTKLLPGDMVDLGNIEDMNVLVVADGGRPASYQQMLLGITKAALQTASVLSAASFQHTINVLAQAAIEGKTDQLIGLKENVILGKLIPAGTGFRRRTMPSLDLDGHGDGGLDLTDELLAELLEEDLQLEPLIIDDDEEEIVRTGVGEPDDIEAKLRSDSGLEDDDDEDDLEDADDDDEEEDDDLDTLQDELVTDDDLEDDVEDEEELDDEEDLEDDEDDEDDEDELDFDDEEADEEE